MNNIKLLINANRNLDLREQHLNKTKIENIGMISRKIGYHLLWKY